MNMTCIYTSWSRNDDTYFSTLFFETACCHDINNQIGIRVGKDLIAEGVILISLGW